MRRLITLGVCTLLLAGCSQATSSSQDGTPTEATPASVATPSATPLASVIATAPKVVTPPRTFTVVSSGDLLLHERLWNQAIHDGKNGKWDFYPQLADIKPIVSGANLALCHLETPLASLGGHYTGYPVFNSPPQIVGAVKKLGFDMCDQTSNHTLDAGAAGIKRTLDDLDKAGIAHTGSYRTEAESQLPLIMTVSTSQGDVKVGILAYTYGFNGFQYPNGHTWLANKIKVSKIKADARAIRAAGAEVVIVKMHWGAEYTNFPNDYQTSIAKKLAASGLVNLIDGDHTHSVQPIQQIGKMWVIYSHGNLDAAQREPETIKSEGVVTRWTFTENSEHTFDISKVEYAPTLITDNLPVRVLDVSKALHTGKWVSTTKTRLQKALKRTSDTITSMHANVSLIQDW